MVSTGRRVQARAWASTSITGNPIPRLTFDTIPEQDARVPRRSGFFRAIELPSRLRLGKRATTLGIYSDGLFPVLYPVLAPERTTDSFFRPTPEPEHLRPP